MMVVVAAFEHVNLLLVPSGLKRLLALVAKTLSGGTATTLERLVVVTSCLDVLQYQV